MNVTEQARERIRRMIEAARVTAGIPPQGLSPQKTRRAKAAEGVERQPCGNCGKAFTMADVMARPGGADSVLVE